MSFDKIQLPGFVIADLYRGNLVLTDAAPPVSPLKPASKPPALLVEKAVPNADKQWFLGSNQKQISIVVHDAEAVYLRDEWLQFLTSILGACKLNIGDVAIVNQFKTEISFTNLQATTMPKFLIMFGVSCSTVQLPFTIPDYQVQAYNNCSILQAPALSLMLGNTEAVKVEKTKLWLSLKKMFNI
ncbi:hypothetical protein [Parasediminibacterium sp. JCM 36343]|uniref:hypothetical protein n=1 Tax=Parasediminibacterium sp. JCM 36343 TaxID=3374279 RepID=UPI0039790D91